MTQGAQQVKPIPVSRDRAQSQGLSWSVGLLLAIACVPLLPLMLGPGVAGANALRAGIVSLTFAGLVWVLRAATPVAAFCGGMVCLLVTYGTEYSVALPELHSGLLPLAGLFVLTFASTRAGRRRKVQAGLAESKRGRKASQVIANLGAAGLVAGGGLIGLLARQDTLPAVLLAVLAEATADTVSSEIGQAFGGRPRLLTTLRSTDVGTDGAVSVTGTLAGVVAALCVVILGAWAFATKWQILLPALLGGVAGLFFDSILGATAERRGLLGNDLVNFFSTVFAGLVAWAIVSFLM